MAEVEYGGVKLTGSKLFMIIHCIHVRWWTVTDLVL